MNLRKEVRYHSALLAEHLSDPYRMDIPFIHNSSSLLTNNATRYYVAFRVTVGWIIHEYLPRLVVPQCLTENYPDLRYWTLAS